MNEKIFNNFPQNTPEEPSEKTTETKQPSKKASALSRLILGVGMGVLGMTGASAETKEKADTAKEKIGIELYTKSNTPEGGITPTGKSNSFLDNPYGYTMDSVIAFAKQEGLPTDSNLELQKALFEKYPDIAQALIEEYGLPNAQMLEDGLLGIRFAETMHLVSLKHPPKTQETPPPTVEKKPDIVHLTDGYVLNVRGDDPTGAYYFFKNKDEFEKFLAAADIPANYGTRGDTWGEITVNMTDAVFRNRCKDKAIEIAGDQIKRDPKNYKEFRYVHNENSVNATPVHETEVQSETAVN